VLKKIFDSFKIIKSYYCHEKSKVDSRLLLKASHCQNRFYLWHLEWKQ